MTDNEPAVKKRRIMSERDNDEDDHVDEDDIDNDNVDKQEKPSEEHLEQPLENIQPEESTSSSLSLLKEEAGVESKHMSDDEPAVKKGRIMSERDNDEDAHDEDDHDDDNVREDEKPSPPSLSLPQEDHLIAISRQEEEARVESKPMIDDEPADKKHRSIFEKDDADLEEVAKDVGKKEAPLEPPLDTIHVAKLTSSRVSLSQEDHLVARLHVPLPFTLNRPPLALVDQVHDTVTKEDTGERGMTNIERSLPSGVEEAKDMEGSGLVVAAETSTFEKGIPEQDLCSTVEIRHPVQENAEAMEESETVGPSSRDACAAVLSSRVVDLPTSPFETIPPPPIHEDVGLEQSRTA